ncbi:MAG: hypothetical protein IJH07_05695 [Ruminococcus sp.]|nr:hypothetical protein [Ruminococcus sp.]
MKKAICFVLVMVLVFACCTVVCAATPTSKLSADTERKIRETPDGEKFEVLVWLNVHVPTVEELDRMTLEELGEEWFWENRGKARFKSYNGLEETFNRSGGGRLLGDIDSDNDLTVIDAASVQRCNAKLREYPEDDNIILNTPVEGALSYYSDFNRDGERDIIDATCIQRYLAGMKYPAG